MSKQICWPIANQVLILLCKQREKDSVREGERNRSSGERCYLSLSRFSSLLSVQQLVMETLHMQMRAGRQRGRGWGNWSNNVRYVRFAQPWLKRVCRSLESAAAAAAWASGKWSLCGNQIIKCWTWLVMAANWQQLRENFRRFQFSSGRQSDLSHVAQTSDDSFSLSLSLALSLEFSKLLKFRGMGITND